MHNFRGKKFDHYITELYVIEGCFSVLHKESKKRETLIVSSLFLTP